jgi:hypothetical protein
MTATPQRFRMSNIIKSVLFGKEYHDFYRIFQIPETEICHFNYECTLQQGLLKRPGRLYLTSHYVCFRTLTGMSKFVVPYNTLESIEKSRILGVPSAIKLMVKGGQKIVFATLVQRDTVYLNMSALWNASTALPDDTDIATSDYASCDVPFADDVQEVEEDNVAGACSSSGAVDVTETGSYDGSDDDRFEPAQENVSPVNHFTEDGDSYPDEAL